MLGRLAVVLGALTLAGAGPALAQEAAREGLIPPTQLTAGLADEFLGQLSPDGKRLYFVTSRNTANEINWQNTDDGRSGLLFDEGSDVTWPRVSPDGKSLLYISFRDHASGQVCVRALPSGEDRRCLEDGLSALQAEWKDAQHLVVLTRASVEGDLRLFEVEVGAKLVPRLLLNRNLTSPAVSPNGRWLVDVPVERYVDIVGPAFAARAAPRLEAIRLDRPDAPPVPLPLDLPGLTGQPTFGRDGKLYVVQFFSDSNRDGVIDASDHGTLFRLPFEQDRDDAPGLATRAFPEQLTDASWNCQYPAPTASVLIATCSSGQSLGVYELPLSGEVPASWSAQRLTNELSFSSDPVERLLMYRRLLATGGSLSARRLLMMRLVFLHLDQDEFRAAEHYVGHVHELKDPLTHGLSHSLFLLIQHREALRDRERGRLTGDFAKATQERMKLLLPREGDSAAALTFAHLVRSEIEDNLGHKTQALAELRAAALDDATPPSVLQAFYERADALFRELDDREALASTCARLSTLASLAPSEQLFYALAATHALTRGKPATLAAADLAQAARGAKVGSELAFALELGQVVLGIADANPSFAVRDAVMALYRKQTLLHRRRAILLEAVGRASDFGADKIIEALAAAYVDAVERGTEERDRAEQLYRRTLLGRAYRRLSERHLATAHADFDAVTDHTSSLESLLQSVRMRLEAGESLAALQKEFAPGGSEAAEARAHFIRAFLLERGLVNLQGDAHQRAVDSAVAELRASWSELRERQAAQALRGALMEEDFRVTGSLVSAERANVHYLVALGLARDDLRYHTLLLQQLGLLQIRLGNYRVGLSYLEERERLPFPDRSIELSVKLAKARALAHIQQEVEAAKAADQALALTDEVPLLARYQLMALDRAALSHLAAREYPRALALYDRELPLVEKLQGTDAQRSRLVARLAYAAAALGADQPAPALAALDTLDRELRDPQTLATLHPPHAKPGDALRTYQRMAAGLRAQAQRKLGDLPAMAQALERRGALLRESLGGSERVQALRQLSLTELNLAENAALAHDPAAARTWAASALAHADTLADEIHTPVSVVQLDALWMGAQVEGLTERQLADAQAKAGAGHAPALRPYANWFDVYRTLKALETSSAVAAPAPH